MMPVLFTRPGVVTDIPAILGVIADARAFLGQQQIDQWQGTYPDAGIVEQDIARGVNRVLVLDDQVVGTATLITGVDPFYLEIDGAWVNGPRAPYAAIHRFAIGDTGRGQHLTRAFFTSLLSELYRDGIRDVRIDTHPENVIMQHVVTSNGFIHRGTVQVDEPVPERLAYQLLMADAK